MAEHLPQDADAHGNGSQLRTLRGSLLFNRAGPPLQRPAQLLHSASDRRVLRGASVDLPIDSLGSRVYQRVPAVSELDLVLFGAAVRSV